MPEIEKLHKEISALLAERELIDDEIQRVSNRIQELEPGWSWGRVGDHCIAALGNPLTWALAWVIVAVWIVAQ